MLGLLPLLAGPFEIRRMRVFVMATATMVALGLGIVVMRDSYLSRMDGGLLILFWLVGSLAIMRHLTPASEPLETAEEHGGLYHASTALVFLALIGLGASVAVRSLVTLSALLNVPQYMLAFVLGALGTSLPELVFDLAAIRSGLKDMAIGDGFGLQLGRRYGLAGDRPTPVPGCRVRLGGGSRIDHCPRRDRNGRSYCSPLEAAQPCEGVALILVYLLAYAALLGSGGTPQLN